MERDSERESGVQKFSWYAFIELTPVIKLGGLDWAEAEADLQKNSSQVISDILWSCFKLM